MEIWRYFRHTWINQYTSVPGRSMMVLVRDAAAKNHPIIGIGAISSPIIQLNERDKWIGWHPDAFLDNIKKNPTMKMAKWLISKNETAIKEIYITDLVRDGLLARRHLKNPTPEAIHSLRVESKYQREAHHRYTDRAAYEGLKRCNPVSKQTWVTKAETHLFRSKRAGALASYLQSKIVLNNAFSSVISKERLREVANSSAGSNAIRKIVKKAKADQIGISMADITVCGAVKPYNYILGGKLVSMLMTSPEVIKEYRQRYKFAVSEIASSMAGRPITRPSYLVYLGTTSLYGTNSSQYNRISIPRRHIDGADNGQLKYIRLGKSESFGTSHYSSETIDSLVDLVSHQRGGQRVNSIFGEGASPKLRKVREGIEELGANSCALLKHGRRRIIYGIPLVKNLKEYLFGFQQKPKYIIPLKTKEASKRICDWWITRWLKMRIQNDSVLQSVSKHTLVEPIRHGARIRIEGASERGTEEFINELNLY